MRVVMIPLGPEVESIRVRNDFCLRNQTKLRDFDIDFEPLY